MSIERPANYLNAEAWGVPIAQSVLEALPFMTTIYQHDGLVVAANEQVWRAFGRDPESTIGIYNLLTDPQVPAEAFRQTHERVLAGETVRPPRLRYDFGQIPEVPRQDVAWFQSTEFPIRNSDTGDVFHVIVIQEITEQVQQEEAAEHTRAEFETQRAEIARQRETISALSTPVVQVWEGILTLPLIGVVDEGRATRITENLLVAIVEHQAESVIIDITGSSAVDDSIINYLINMIRACHLLGSDVALVGISSGAAAQIARMDVDLVDITTLATLRAGIAWALKRQGLAIGPEPVLA